MSLHLILPSFDAADAQGMEQGQLPEERLAAYEEGYKAGWDDALSASEGDSARINAELAQSLQEMAFPYHEARAHVLAALRPLLAAMAERVLPGAARAQFAATVLEAAMDLAADMAAAPFEITLAPDNVEPMQALIDAAAPALPLRLVPAAGVGPGVAWLKAGEAEREIDLDAVLAAIGRALDDFLATTQEARAHG